jgi:hypothetical protein
LKTTGPSSICFPACRQFSQLFFLLQLAIHPPNGERKKATLLACFLPHLKQRVWLGWMDGWIFSARRLRSLVVLSSLFFFENCTELTFTWRHFTIRQTDTRVGRWLWRRPNKSSSSIAVCFSLGRLTGVMDHGWHWHPVVRRPAALMLLVCSTSSRQGSIRGR